MGKGNAHFGFLMALLVLLAGFPVGVVGQSARINFGSYNNYNLDILAVGTDVLEFGQVMTGDPDVVIHYDDPRAVVLEITGVEYLDVNITITPPPGYKLLRDGDPDTGIGVNIKMAYYNQAAAGPEIAVAQAVEVTGEMITFPIRRRAGGPPGPPPTPGHSGYTPPMAKAYLIIYGTLFVGSEPLKAGTYNGETLVEVSY